MGRLWRIWWRLAGAALFLFCGVALAGEPATGSLRVVIENLPSDRGAVRVALWQGPEGFTAAAAALAITAARPLDGRAEVTFADLPPGRYAIAAFHDENGNGKLDTNWFGWPAEALGFSNGAWINRGRPSFDSAAFSLPHAPESLVIALRN